MEDRTAITILCCWGVCLLAIPALIVAVVRLYRTVRQAKAARVVLEQERDGWLENAQEAARELWFKEVPGLTFRNEIEVETKFIYPLVKHLGYADQDIQLRVPVRVRLGRTDAVVEADWVLWDTDPTSGTREPVVVIEANTPTESLGEDVRLQARSYAYGLEVSIYVVTNGKEIRIFERGETGDTCVAEGSVTTLSALWP